VTDDATATEALAELVEARAEAQRRVREIEGEQGAAAQMRQEARARLVEAERRGVRPAELRKHEQALADAETKPNILGARLEGARHGLRDADVEVARFVVANLREVVEPLEEEGRLVAADFNAHAEALVAAYHRREAIASEISRLAAMTGRMRPGDVARGRGEAVVRAASDLLRAGGELPPTLDRDPRQPRHGALAEAVPAA
jgi:hypothetical protein